MTKVLNSDNKNAFANRCREEWVKDYCKRKIKENE
jgi:hypothetical protein